MPAAPPTVVMLADHPELVREAGILRWIEWGYDDPSPDGWISITAREAGRADLPLTLVAVGGSGEVVGVVGLDAADDALTEAERAGRSPWLVGMVVRRDSRLRGIGRTLIRELADAALDLHHDRMWVVTGGAAADYYRACGWIEVEHLVTSREHLPSTVLTWACEVDRSARMFT